MKYTSVQIRLSSLLTLLALGLLSGCGEHDTNTTTVKIAFAGPLTGDTSHIGQDYQNGMMLAVKDLNAKSLKLNGKNLKFQLISQDDASDPKTATMAAVLLLDKDAIAVIGHVDSGCSIAASSIYHKAQIPQIAPSVSNQQYTKQGFNNTFRMMAADDVQGKMLANFISQKFQHPMVAIIDDSSSYGQNLAVQVEKSLRQLNISVVAHEYTYRGNLDYSPLLSRINKTNATILFFAGTASEAASVLKQERSVNKKITFMTGDMGCTPHFMALSGNASEGAYCSRNTPPVDEKPAIIEFKKRYEDTFKMTMEPYAAFSYDATMLVAKAILDTKSTHPKDLISALHATHYKGLTGDIAFNKSGDPASPKVTIFRLVNRDFVVEKTYT